MAVAALLELSLTVADIAAAAAFFRDRLGLETTPARPVDDSTFCALLGLPGGTRAVTARVAVGKQSIELVAFDPPGKPYPPARAANDPWFQHVALVCRDIGPIAARLAGGDAGVISAGGPVPLPPSTGSVTAFKFRDPEGHPLELIAFPAGVGDPVWQARPGNGLLGYDHTAIAVSDVDRSLAFYVGLLGLKPGGRTLNRGPEQDRLDGLTGCMVDVVALEPAVTATPHVELLHYRTPPARASGAAVMANDVAAMRQVHAVGDLPALVARLRAAGAAFVSEGTMTLADGRRAASVRDPDGHMLVLVEEGASAD